MAIRQTVPAPPFSPHRAGLRAGGRLYAHGIRDTTALLSDKRERHRRGPRSRRGREPPADRTQGPQGTADRAGSGP